MLTKKTKFIIAIAIQLAVIFGIIAFKGVILLTGTEVFLRIEPIDPRDPLRGDYLTFQYKISELDSYLFTYSPIKNGETVYVPLQRQGTYWAAIYGIQKTKPVETKKVFIKGKVVSAVEEGELEMIRVEAPEEPQEFIPSRVRPGRVRVIYGIEEYFIPEGLGQDFNFWNREAAAKVSIDQNGNAVLKQIYVNQNPWP